MSSLTLSGSPRLRLSGPAYNHALGLVHEATVEISLGFEGVLESRQPLYLEPPEDEWSVTLDDTPAALLAELKDHLRPLGLEPIDEREWHELAKELLEEHLAEHISEYAA